MVGGAALFQPWLFWVNHEVADVIPSATTRAPAEADRTVESQTEASRAEASEMFEVMSRGPIVVRSGTFLSHEHETTGKASIIQVSDGTRLLAIEDLSTTSGPDVHVWLSAGEAIPGRDGWLTAGRAPHVDLGDIKGNRGDQVYRLPADVGSGGVRRRRALVRMVRGLVRCCRAGGAVIGLGVDQRKNVALSKRISPSRQW
ncbi:DM13 domain-containing protein [Gordonia sp. (in: high G+C Gram-positive bacteria)]|uniref:DM13 domain-containing protein n=1 Tax=Gordonia sp. (in: high G+C Gram-positive bacteria) TaxID=84139 RepID=UPI0039E3B7B2